MTPLRIRTRGREAALAAAALAVLVLATHRDVVFGGRAFFDRDVEHFLYERLFAFRAAIASGAWPLWNPLPAFGEPMLAIANQQILYPTTWLALVLPPDVTDAVIVVLHVFVAALGAWALARELGASWGAALVAGALWAVSGPLQSCADQANMLVGASWVAWAFWAFARHARTGRDRDAVLAGLAVAACALGGSPESAMTAGAGILFAVPMAERGSRRSLLRVLRAGGIAALLGAGLSAAQWIPTAALVPQSTRAGAGLEGRSYWSNHPLGLAQVLLPLPFEDLPLERSVRQRLFEGREPLLYSLYLGLPALALSAAALLGGPRRGRWLLAGIALGGFWLSLGRHGLLWNVVGVLPPLSLVRFPARFSVGGALPLVVLAGLGVDALATGVASASRRRWWIACGAVAALAAGVALLAREDAPVWKRLLSTDASFGPWAASAMIQGMLRGLARESLLAVPVVVALGLRSRARLAALPFWAGLAALASVVDAALALGGVNPTVPRALLLAPPPALARIPRQRPNRTLVVAYSGAMAQRLIGRSTPQQHVYDAPPELRLWNGRYYPVDCLGSPGWSIESIPGDVTGLRDAGTTRFIAALNGLVGTPAFPRLVRLSGIEHLIALHELPPEHFRPLSVAQGRFAPVRTYAVVNPLPRAYAVAGVRVGQGQKGFDALADEGFDPLGEVVLEAGGERPAGRLGRVTIRRWGFDTMLLESETEAPGRVVLLEAYDPGWRATVDGRPARVERANLVFRAVAVPAGRHTVEFSYRPTAVVWGAGVSLTTAAIALAVGLARTVARGTAVRAPCLTAV